MKKIKKPTNLFTMTKAERKYISKYLYEKEIRFFNPSMKKQYHQEHRHESNVFKSLEGIKK